MKGLSLKLRKQTFFKLSLFIFAGAIINVAVAWGFTVVFWKPFYIYGGFSAGPPVSVNWARMHAHPGWPSESLTSVTRTASWAHDKYFFAVGKYCFACRPVWPGFAINTIFYAGILWLLFAAPGKLRRRIGGRRIKRRLCLACKYPVGTNPRCTECGHSVMSTAAAGDSANLGRREQSP